MASSTPTPAELEPLSVKTTPKKETARITAAPEPKAMPKATMRMAQTQPLMAPPSATIQSSPITVATSPASRLNEVPVPFYYGVVGIAAVTLLIQLWTYFS